MSDALVDDKVLRRLTVNLGQGRREMHMSQRANLCIGIVN